MANLKWDIHNWLTVLLMVGIAYSFAGVVKSLIAGGGISSNMGA
jgi:hypothetical protein